MLFLSYATQDGNFARQITAMLRELGIDVYNWRDRRGGRFIREIEQAIGQADGFVALMSPYFLESEWCREELDLALRREHDLRASHPGRTFICVLKVADTPHNVTGFVGNRDWLDVISEENRDEMLAVVVNRLTLGSGADTEGPAVDSAARCASLFRNRTDELDQVLNGLTNMAGPHFWLVVAPPQLGKTWFLDRLHADITQQTRGVAQWTTKLIDLHVQPSDVGYDTRSLLVRLFEPLVGAEQASLRTIAREISRSGRSYLCLLDGGELLDEKAIAGLRASLGSIYRYVQEMQHSDVRLAFVVATRYEQGWRGVASDPRLSVLSLTEFQLNVVLQALRDLAEAMDRTMGMRELRLYAERIHRLSEGLPALLVPCREWIRRDEWLEPRRLETEELFAEIAHPYIAERLLSVDSLYPVARGQRPEQSAGPMRALEQAFRLLAPYRLFTQSHLRHHAESDPGFRAAMEGLSWSVPDMWAAISASALLLRPLDEPWQEIYPAIRRLLYRYFYRTADERAHAHHEARKFVEVWGDRQSGKEQVVGLVESLWHEACEVRLTQAAELEERLSASARTLSIALRSSEAYTVAELRDFAATRLKNDEELRQVLDNNVEIFNRLTAIVTAPEPER